MDKTEKEAVLKIIKNEIEKTTQAIKNYKVLTQPIAPENAIGRVSRMDAINNKSVNEAALKKAEQKLSNLNIALANIDDQDFGICYKCKSNIPIGRILLMPHARFCVNCAS
jgi:DnaK suppressor protein